jgi:hypothetical protein
VKYKGEKGREVFFKLYREEIFSYPDIFPTEYGKRIYAEKKCKGKDSFNLILQPDTRYIFEAGTKKEGEKFNL